MCPSSLHRDEQGSALLEVITLGSAIVILVTTLAMGAVSVIETGESARAAARTGAVWGARYGDEELTEETALSQAPDGSLVSAVRDRDVIRVVVRSPLTLFSPTGAQLGHVVGTAGMPIAPYRSNRG